MTKFSDIAFHSSHYIVFPWLVSAYTKAPSKLIKFPLKPHKISPVDVYYPQDVSYVHLVLIDLPLLNLSPRFPPALWSRLPPDLAQGTLPFVPWWGNSSVPWNWAWFMGSDSYSQTREVQQFALALGSGCSPWSSLQAHSSLPKLLPDAIPRNPSTGFLLAWTGRGIWETTGTLNMFLLKSRTILKCIEIIQSNSSINSRFISLGRSPLGL